MPTINNFLSFFCPNEKCDKSMQMKYVKDKPFCPDEKIVCFNFTNFWKIRLSDNSWHAFYKQDETKLKHT